MSGFATVFILLQLIIPFVPNIACNSVPKFSIINDKIHTANASNKKNGCDPKISESALHFILELMRDKITHVIDLHIWAEPVNNTGNKVQVLTGIKWANEIGRTLISLIAEAKKSDKFMFLSHTSTMTAGTYSMNIFVSEEVMECFSFSENTTAHTIFDLLVETLYHITGNKTGYKLCLPHNDNDNQVAKYNCCTIVGSNDALICSDYSSVVTEMSSILVLVTVLLILYVLFPVTLEHFSQFNENDTHYKISNSTMSLSYFLFLVLLKGHGPVKTLGRKLILALFVLVTTLPKYGSLLFQCYMIFMGPWLAVLFIGNISFDEKFLFRSFQNPVEIITIPFNIKMCWCKAKQFPSAIKGCWSRFQTKVKLCCSCLFSGTSRSESEMELTPKTDREQNIEEDASQPQSEEEENETENHEKLSFIQRTKKRFFALVFFILYLISIPFLSLYAFARLILQNWKFVKKQVLSNSDQGACMPRYNANRMMLFIVVTCGFIVFSIHNLFPLALNFIIGLFLNGEIYSPYILPLCTTTFYSWTKWRSSVEMKYLALIMNIYIVCKESRVESDECSDITENSNMASETDQSSTTAISRKCFIITPDHDGEAIIPTELYHLVREKLLPYDRILFHYFQGVLFIAIFGYLLYILMSLAQTSGISSTLQIIGTIAASSLPFIFDFVWKKNSDEQKKVDTIALRLKLNHILLVRNRNDQTGKIDVEVKHTD